MSAKLPKLPAHKQAWLPRIKALVWNQWVEDDCILRPTAIAHGILAALPIARPKRKAVRK
jgi:hypothetical protein